MNEYLIKFLNELQEKYKFPWLKLCNEKGKSAQVIV